MPLLPGVQGVSLETELLPTLQLADASSGEAGQPWLARLLKPRLVVDTAIGPLDWSPAGSPVPGRLWGLVAIGLVVVVGLALFGASKLLR